MVTTRSGVVLHFNSVRSNTCSRPKGKHNIVGTVRISPKPKSSSSSTSKSRTAETKMADAHDIITDQPYPLPQVEDMSLSKASNSNSTPHFHAVSTPTSNDKSNSSANVPETAPSEITTTILRDLAASSPLSGHPDGSMAGDDVADRSFNVSDVPHTTSNDAVSMPCVVPSKQGIIGKGKSSGRRKTVTFQEPVREAARMGNSVPIGDARDHIRPLRTAKTMGKKRYLQYIKRRYPATTPSHVVPPVRSSTQLVGDVVCKEPVYGLGWRVSSDELCRIMGHGERLRARTSYFDWLCTKLECTGFWDNANTMDYPELYYNKRNPDLSPMDDVFILISYNLPRCMDKIADAEYRTRLIHESAIILGFSPERRDQVEWHRKIEGEHWK